MLGGFGVGKTSLVKRFVTGLFSENYHTTIGVKIDQKLVTLNHTQVLLVLWDLYGEDDFQKIRASYLRGTSGYVLVVDGTRKETVSTAVHLHEFARNVIGEVPFALMVNKHDLTQEWVYEASMLDSLAREALMIIETSAKTGQGVEQTFLELTRRMIESPP